MNGSLRLKFEPSRRAVVGRRTARRGGYGVGQMSTPITVYGDVDPRAVEQLQRCADAGDALRGALCADGHVGYSQPIGGAVAYADYISPSGVGYDIACIAAGTPVTTADGYFKPIEHVVAGEPVLGWDAVRTRVVEPCEGALARGTRELRRLTLALGRELLLTDDHRVRTRLGWKRADELRAGDAVACSPFVGLPFEDGGMAPELLRLVAYCAGDGHLGIDGKTIAWYSNSALRHRRSRGGPRAPRVPRRCLRASRAWAARAHAPLGRAARPLPRARRAGRQEGLRVAGAPVRVGLRPAGVAARGLSSRPS